MRRRHAIFSGHYQDLGISSFTMYESACSLIRNVKLVRVAYKTLNGG